MPDIEQTIAIEAPRERVYEALTTADGLRKWWTRTADLDSRLGGAGEFRFNACQTITTVRIDELRSPARVAWTATSSNAPGGWTLHRRSTYPTHLCLSLQRSTAKT